MILGALTSPWVHVDSVSTDSLDHEGVRVDSKPVVQLGPVLLYQYCWHLAWVCSAFTRLQIAFCG